MVILTLLSCCIWIYLLLGRDNFWRADQRLGWGLKPPRSYPAICAIIPARNEAETIQAVITSHQHSAYPGRFDIILIDDQSTDDTATLAKAAAQQAGALRSLTIVPGGAPETGWSGKVNAQQQGWQTAQVAAQNYRYVLLTDADIVHAPHSLTQMVHHAEEGQCDLVSLMARLDCRGFWGTLLVPAFIYFFQQLYPFPAVNNFWNRVSGAAGGCMLVSTKALEEIGGFAAIKNDLIDDCALAAVIKAEGKRRIFLGLADSEVVSLRDNRALNSIWSMVTRTAFTQLDYSLLQLAGAVLGMAITYLVPVIALVTGVLSGSPLLFGLGATALLLLDISYRPTLRLYRLPAWHGLWLPVAALFYLAMTVHSAWQYLFGSGNGWKGRQYGRETPDTHDEV